jgi:hypothetical protein
MRMLHLLLVFAAVAAGHYFAAFLAFKVCLHLSLQAPAPVIYWLFFFPAEVSERTGMGIVPSGQWSIVDTPWAMEINSLLWAITVCGLSGLGWRVANQLIRRSGVGRHRSWRRLRQRLLDAWCSLSQVTAEDS